MTKDVEAKGLEAVALPGFEPADALCSGDEPLYPSRASLEWALRSNRQALMQASAIALLRGRVFVKRQELVRIVQHRAVADYRKRYGEAEH
jgi:hypothetical protein